MEERESKRRSREGVRWLIRERIMEELQERHHMDDGELLEMIDRSIGEMGQEIFLPLKERPGCVAAFFDSFRRLDILQELIDDSTVSEIMVNGAGKIFMEKNGRMELWDRNFERPEQLEDIIQQIVSRVNRVVNVSSPMVDARLEDGSRVHVVLPPVALDGPVVTIRKFPDPITMEKLIRFKAISTEAADFLEQLVEDGCNMFISGGTNSGKTTFLNALSSFIPPGERVITIEDSAELQITQVPNLVRLETRNANTEGEGEITMSQLIKAALRMNPNRIVVGEVRGKEALDMLQAMNTGHPGSLSTGHGNSPRDMISRLETMVLMAADLPLAAIRSQIVSALDIMVHLGRLKDGKRRVLSIMRIGGLQNGEVELEPLFEYDGKGGPALSERGRGTGWIWLGRRLPGGNRKRRPPAPDRVDYSTYRLTAREWLLYGALGVGGCLASYVFYRSVAVFLILIPAGVCYPLLRKEHLKKERARQLELQFKEGIQVLSSFLSAGYSLENGLTLSIKELEVLFGRREMITEEFRILSDGIRMNRPAEELFMDFGRRCGLEDVDNFAQSFANKQVAAAVQGDHPAGYRKNGIGIREMSSAGQGRRYTPCLLQDI